MNEILAGSGGLIEDQLLLQVRYSQLLQHRSDLVDVLGMVLTYLIGEQIVPQLLVVRVNGDRHLKVVVQIEVLFEINR